MTLTRKAAMWKVPARSGALFLTGLLLGCLALLCVAALGRPASAAVTAMAGSAADSLTVCPEGPPLCDFATVQGAVDSATDGVLVKISAGTYTDMHARPSPAGYLGPEVITQVVYLSKTLTLRGGYSVADGFADPPDPLANATTLDAQGVGRVLFVCGSSHPTVEGLRITGGDPTGLGGDLYAEQAGGGAYVMTATLTFTGNLVYGNTAGPEGSAAGMMLWRSDSILHHNSFSDNHADKDGGGLYTWLSRATIEHNSFTGNSAGVFGGGLHLWYGPFAVAANTVLSNTALAGAGMQIGGADGSVIRENQVLSNTAYAGAVYVQYTGWISPTWFLSNTLAHNTAEWGGAIYLMYGPAQFVGNQILDNRASEGGGVDGFSSDALFEDNEIRANSAISEGGGLRLEYSRPTLRGNLFSGNGARDGGGIALLSSPAQISASEILSNAALSGGGIYLLDSDAELLNVILGGNTALEGSALYAVGSDPRLCHTTIARRAGAGGAGLWLDAGPAPSCTSSLTDTILAGHEIGLYAGAGCTVTLAGTLWDNEIDWAGPGSVVTGTVNLWGDPAFLAPLRGDYHLHPWSPAVDAGVPAGVLSDIDGDPRPLGWGYDLGADECAWASRYLPLVGK